MAPLPGFVKADSSKLPRLDSFMHAQFYSDNPNFCSAELRNKKTTLSARDSYGDKAVERVQLKRENGLCIVKGRLVPEHRVQQTPYHVTLVINEKELEVVSVECHDCPAASGGCKHAVAFLSWVHRRSEDPSVTSVECYWRRSELSSVGTSLKFKTVEDMKGPPSKVRYDFQDKVLRDFLVQVQGSHSIQIAKHFPTYEFPDVLDLSLHQLAIKFKKPGVDADGFLDEVVQYCTSKRIETAERQTREQHTSQAWHELRYARITASKAYDVSRCQTSDGCLVGLIMGAKLPDTRAMERGRRLEEQVRTAVSQQKGNIELRGLTICAKFPFLAASPDGVLNGDTLVEIKCPSSEKSFKTYIRNNEITEKYEAQMMTQMYAMQLTKGLFCVADPDFERNGRVQTLSITFDEQKFRIIREKVTRFWKDTIYNLL